MKEQIIKTDKMAVPGGLLPVNLVEYQMNEKDEDSHGFYITVDGVEWCDTGSLHHAAILFEMIRAHAAEFMHYEVLPKDG